MTVSSDPLQEQVLGNIFSTTNRSLLSIVIQLAGVFITRLFLFKIVIKHNFIKSVDELLDDQIYLLRKPPFQTRNTNEDEKNLIINNFIKSISNKTDEILDPKDLNLSKDHPLLWSNSLISKSWYNLQKNNL